MTMNSSGDGSTHPDPRDDRTDRSTGSDLEHRKGLGGETHDGGGGSSSARDWVHWAWRTDRGAVVILREVAISVALVAFVGVLLFGVSGIWPPMVAIESGSMEPHMFRGDLVFIADNQRFASDVAVDGTGIVPAEIAAETGYQKFGAYGDVIVYMPNGDDERTPIIHRAHLWVEEGEDWYDRADHRYVGAASSCDEIRSCPAPHAGFITLGDNNRGYDQVVGQSDPVKEEWVVGTARVRVPWLGWVRLYVAQSTPGSLLVFDHWAASDIDRSDQRSFLPFD